MWSLWPITADANTMNQSEFETNTRNQCRARENACEQITIGLGLTSDWLRKWRECFFKPITRIALDTQLRSQEFLLFMYLFCNYCLFMCQVNDLTRSSSSLSSLFKSSNKSDVHASRWLEDSSERKYRNASVHILKRDSGNTKPQLNHCTYQEASRLRTREGKNVSFKTWL